VVVRLVLGGERFTREDGTGGLPVGPVEAGGTRKGGGVRTVHGSDRRSESGGWVHFGGANQRAVIQIRVRFR
jgi:hypothetical protein